MSDTDKLIIYMKEENLRLKQLNRHEQAHAYYRAKSRRLGIVCCALIFIIITILLAFLFKP